METLVFESLKQIVALNCLFLSCELWDEKFSVPIAQETCIALVRTWYSYLDFLKYLCKNWIIWRMKGAFSFRLFLVIHSLSFYLFFPLYDIVHSNRYFFVIYISFQELITFMLIQVFKSTGVEELMFLVSQLKTKLHPQVNPS